MIFSRFAPVKAPQFWIDSNINQLGSGIKILGSIITKEPLTSDKFSVVLQKSFKDIYYVEKGGVYKEVENEQIVETRYDPCHNPCHISTIQDRCPKLTNYRFEFIVYDDSIECDHIKRQFKIKVTVNIDGKKHVQYKHLHIYRTVPPTIVVKDGSWRGQMTFRALLQKQLYLGSNYCINIHVSKPVTIHLTVTQTFWIRVESAAKHQLIRGSGQREETNGTNDKWIELKSLAVLMYKGRNQDSVTIDKNKFTHLHPTFCTTNIKCNSKLELVVGELTLSGSLEIVRGTQPPPCYEGYDKLPSSSPPPSSPPSSPPPPPVYQSQINLT